MWPKKCTLFDNNFHLSSSPTFNHTLFLFSCSKKPAASNAQSQSQSSQRTTGLPFQPMAVESSETKEIHDLQKQASALLKARQFDKLDDLAKNLRDSKECFADGQWKLFHFYNGISFPNGATDSEWTGRFAVFRDWIKAKPSSITAQVALADALVSYAWQARGFGYEDKVAGEDWKIFFQRLKDAVNVLNKSRTFKEQCPRWWAAMLRAELGLQTKRSDYDATFNAAIQAWPGYKAYYSMRANYLLPRWHGADGELEKDLEKSADRIGGEGGDMVYAQVVWSLHHSVVDATNIFLEYNLSWERTDDGLGIIEKRYPNSLAVENEAAHLAMLAHDRPAAKKYFDQTKGGMDLSAWPSTNVFIQAASLVYGDVQW
jgi:hypothetical protein